jgi:uncharacterized protein involved in exopolysaccharide biosynthesis
MSTTTDVTSSGLPKPGLDDTSGVRSLAGFRGDDRGPQLTLLTLVNVALRARYLIVALAIVAFGVVAVRGLRQARTYSAGASFITQGSKPASSNIAGLAAQLGVNVGAGDAGTSPAFYLDLVQSRGILRSVAESTYRFTSDTGAVAGKLDRILGVPGSTPAQLAENTTRSLRSRITPTLNQKTGMVTFVVRSPYRELSFEIVNRILVELNRFNLERRQSQAAMERKFAQARLTDAESQLRSVEDQLQEFFQRNRDYRNSPTLVFQAERLQREIGLRQQVFAALAQSLEQAKLDEVRDTPVLTVVEAPEIPADPDARGLVRKSFVALVVGGLAGFVLALFGEWFGRAKADSRNDVAEFARLRRETVTDLRHPLRALRRRSFESA